MRGHSLVTKMIHSKNSSPIDRAPGAQFKSVEFFKCIISVDQISLNLCLTHWYTYWERHPTQITDLPIYEPLLRHKIAKLLEY